MLGPSCLLGICSQMCFQGPHWDRKWWLGPYHIFRKANKENRTPTGTLFLLTGLLTARLSRKAGCQDTGVKASDGTGHARPLFGFWETKIEPLCPGSHKISDVIGESWSPDIPGTFFKVYAWENKSGSEPASQSGIWQSQFCSLPSWRSIRAHHIGRFYVIFPLFSAGS